MPARTLDHAALPLERCAPCPSGVRAAAPPAPPPPPTVAAPPPAAEGEGAAAATVEDCCTLESEKERLENFSRRKRARRERTREEPNLPLELGESIRPQPFVFLKAQQFLFQSWLIS